MQLWRRKGQKIEKRGVERKKRAHLDLPPARGWLELLKAVVLHLLVDLHDGCLVSTPAAHEQDVTQQHTSFKGDASDACDSCSCPNMPSSTTHEADSCLVDDGGVHARQGGSDSPPQSRATRNTKQSRAYKRNARSKPVTQRSCHASRPRGARYPG